MKKTKALFAGLLVLIPAIMTMAAYPTESEGQPGDSLRISSSPGLEGLVASWVNTYSGENQGILFTAIYPVKDRPAGTNSISFISEADRLSVSTAGWKMVVAHDAVVPVISSGNPIIKEVLSQGITSAEFEKIINGSGKILWSDIIPGGPRSTVNMFIQDDPSVSRSLSKFIRSDIRTDNPAQLKSSGEIIRKVSSDPYSIGFCRLNDLLAPGPSSISQGLYLLPVDRNGNGRIDNFEKIYDTPEALLRGVWAGKYPHALSGSIYAASATKPTDKKALAFLRWVISSGDRSLRSAGFSALAMSEKESGLASLTDSEPIMLQPAQSQHSYSFLLLLFVIVVSATIIAILLRSRRKKEKVPSVKVAIDKPLFNENTVTSPAGLYFDKSHTWTFMERDGLVRIGIDDFIQHITGTITGIRMKETGEFIRRGEKLVTIIKEGKQLNLYAPVSGLIRSLNTDLYLDASIINSSPYTDGWLYLIEPSNWSKEIQMMFVSKGFREWITDEITRLKDFLATTLKSHLPSCSMIVLQDGGELSDNVLDKLGPEIWEDFQTSFIDKSR